MAGKITDAQNALNRIDQFRRTYIDGMLNDVRLVLDGAVEAQAVGAKEKKEHTERIEQAAASKIELEQLNRALPTTKQHVTEARAELRAVNQEIVDKRAELAGEIKASEKKLAQLEQAIRSKAGELGAAIAQELI